MRLYLVRHAKAEKDAPTGRDDDRPLKPRGIHQAEWLAGELARTSGKHAAAVILTSPIVRAINTAQILHRTLKVPMETRDELSTHSNASDYLKVIGECVAAGRSAIIVGHNPTLEQVAAVILPASSREQASFRTGECLVIELPAGALLGRGRLAERMRADDGEGE